MPIKMEVGRLNFFYGNSQALYDITNPTWQLNVSFILDPDSALPPVDVVMTGTLHCAAAGDRA